MKKLISIIAALTILIGVTAGCGDSKKVDAGSSVNASSTVLDDSIFSTDKVNFVDGKTSVYRIIRPANADKNVTSAAAQIVKGIKGTFGNGINIRNLDDTEEGTDQYEILIGDTNRTESASAKEYLRENAGGRYDDFIICTIGKKIVINAVCSDKITAAADYFISNFVKEGGVEGGIKYISKTEGEFADVTINGVKIGFFNIIRPHFNFSYITQNEINTMSENLRNKTGYYLETLHDAYVAEGTYEIIVGNANRAGVEKIGNYDEYKITISGTKVYINGGSPYATGVAVTEFAKLLEKGTLTDSDSVFGSYSQTVSNYDTSKYLSIKWREDFDEPTINLKTWRILKGSEQEREGKNGKISGFTDDPNVIFTSNGCLNVWGYQDDKQYRGGMLVSDSFVNYMFGYIELSCIMPDGDGFWSLLWLCSNDKSQDGGRGLLSPEIDVNECFGNAAVVAANCHAWPTSKGTAAGLEHYSNDAKYSKEKKYWCPDEKKFSDEFHTFGMLWDDTKMAFTGDGDFFFTYQTNTNENDLDAFCSDTMYLLLGMSVGRKNNSLDISNATPEEWQNTGRLIADYIHIYQYDDGKSKLLLT